jgi:hypothetical protein
MSVDGTPDPLARHLRAGNLTTGQAGCVSLLTAWTVNHALPPIGLPTTLPRHVAGLRVPVRPASVEESA